MRIATIYPHLSLEELAVWTREAPDKESYQRRLAIWITAVHHFSAQKIADILCVSKQAIWLWISQYNHNGPDGLRRKGRGGRRWAFMSLAQEEELLGQLIERARKGEILTASRVRPTVEKFLNRKVSVSYIYRLLHRHGWRKISPRPKHEKNDKKRQEVFKKNSQN